MTRRRHALETSKSKKGKKGPTAAELREDDFRAYLGSGSESEGEDDPEAIERMRKLMNLDGDENGQGSSEGVFGRRRDVGLGGGEEEGDMQVTFMPGLSEAANRKARGEKKKDDDAEETTLEKYMRKQREKREKRKNKLSNQEEDDDEEKGNEEENGNVGWDDPFFQEAGDEMDFEAPLAAEEEGGSISKNKSSKKDKKDKKKLSAEEEAELKRSKAELQLMVDDDSADEFGGSRSHFDMKDVIRAEKGDKKSKKSKKYRKNKEDEEDRGPGSIQPGFEINVNDDRFKGLMEDHRFALDPSHPSFIKTKGMDQLMEERRKKQKSKMGDFDDAPREESLMNGKEKKLGKEEDWKGVLGRIKKRDRGGEESKGSNRKDKSKKRKV